eukprot:190463_1
MATYIEDYIKIGIVGEPCIGKSTLLYRCIEERFPQHTKIDPSTYKMRTTTISFAMDKEHIMADLDLYEFTEKFTELSTWFDRDIYLFCFSLTDANSLQKIKSTWHSRIGLYKKCPIKLLVGLKHDLGYDRPLFLYGYIRRNAPDLNIIDDVIRIIIQYETDAPWDATTKEQRKEIMNTCGCIEYIRVCSLHGTNVDKLFQTAVTAFIKDRRNSTRQPS